MEHVHRIEEIHRQISNKPRKEEEQTIRWRGRKVVIRKNATFACSSGSDNDQEDERFTLLRLLKIASSH
jgi:hypothetical protein